MKFSTSFIALAATILNAAGVQASPTTYDDRATWKAAITHTQDWLVTFDSFTTEEEFRTKALDIPKDVGGPGNAFSLHGPSTFTRNYIDIPPIQFSVFEIDGTVANMLVRGSESETIEMVFETPVRNLGMDFASASDPSGGKLDLELVLECPTMSMTLQVPNHPGNVVFFFGFMLSPTDEPVVKVIFKARTTPGNDGFSMDNIEHCREPDATMTGDPHIKQWNGHWFDYHGECDLVLVESKALDLSVHVRTTIRHHFSYIESAAIRIGNDILEVGSWADFFYNGVFNPVMEDLPGSNLGGYPFYFTRESKKRTKFDIVLGPGENITVTTIFDIVSVTFTGGTEEHFGGSTGIMGSYDGQLKMRDGTVVTSYNEKTLNEVGQDWQVKETEPMLFQSVRAPQHPTEKCRLPTAETAAEMQRALSESPVAPEQAEEACKHLAGDARKACVYDVMILGDVDMAEAGAY